MPPPATKREIHVTTFGKQKEDDSDTYMNPPISTEDAYHWLRDDERENTEILDHLKAENVFTQEYMNDTKDLQEELYQSFKSRVLEDSETYPFPKWDFNSKWLYFNRKYSGKGYKASFRKSRDGTQEELLLDVNKLAVGHEYCSVAGPKVTSDHKIMAYGTDFDGEEWYDYTFWDITTTQHTQIVKKFPKIRSNMMFMRDSNHIIHKECDEAQKPYRVRMFNWDTDEDIILYEEMETEFSVGSATTDRDENGDSYLLIYSSCADKQKIMWHKIHNGKPDMAPYFVMDFDIKYGCVEYVNADLIYISCNYGHETYMSLFTASLETLEDPEKWTIYLDDPDININDVHITKDYAILDVRLVDINRSYLVKHGNNQPFNRNTYLVPSDYTEDMGIRNEGYVTYYESNTVYCFYNTSVVPTRILELELELGKYKHVWSEPVPNYNMSLYSSKRIYVKARDGKEIPCTVCQHKNTANSNSKSIYLYGYGSYGHTIEPTFSKNIFTFLDKGFIHVVAHVRGSSMKGEAWHLDGKMYNKMNTFTDFIDVAEYLRRQYPGAKVAAEGRSAGGLLMGSVYHMAPELFDVVVAGVPFVDVLNTMQDATIPLTVGEWKHWGNPNIEKDYNYMKQYSPYDNLRAHGCYPQILLLAGLNDPRVAYWEPAKFAAKLRYLNPQVQCHLKTEMDKGHFGNTDRYHYYREKAHDFAYVIKALQN